MEKPLILVTNDDGINAPGIRKLIELMKPLGKVVVVAPETAQSAMGHAITVRIPLQFHLIQSQEDYTEYSLNGTPVDCVKFALHQLLSSPPDLIVSGINHGSNASVNIIYSGTMGAALEGAMANIPSIGFSILDYAHHARFDEAEKYILHLVKLTLKKGLEPYTALNVNFPKSLETEYKGLKICRQSRSYWKEDFEERIHPSTGKAYFWLKGSFSLLEESHDTDEYALKNYQVSVVPVHFDFTHYQQIEALRSWENNLT